MNTLFMQKSQLLLESTRPNLPLSHTSTLTGIYSINILSYIYLGLLQPEGSPPGSERGIKEEQFRQTPSEQSIIESRPTQRGILTRTNTLHTIKKTDFDIQTLIEPDEYQRLRKSFLRHTSVPKEERTILPKEQAKYNVKVLRGMKNRHTSSMTELGEGKKRGRVTGAYTNRTEAGMGMNAIDEFNINLLGNATWGMNTMGKLGNKGKPYYKPTERDIQRSLGNIIYIYIYI